MEKFILSAELLNSLVDENNYVVESEKQLISRCIDGRYENTPDLPALAVPGADAGELALIFATVNNYGLTVDMKKTYKVFLDIIGGEKKLQFHSDSHADPSCVLAGCGHIKQINLTEDEYGLTKEQCVFIQDAFQKAEKHGAKQTILHGEHNESAVLLISGEYGIYPQYRFETGSGERQTSVFEYHQTFADRRHRALVSALLKNNAVTLPAKCDADYLYQSMSETAENHLMETARRLAKGLPVYKVSFDNESGFTIKELDVI